MTPADPMSSKFNRPARTQRKPAVCRKPPQPGPFDPTWPPKIGTGLCKWEGPSPSGPDYFAQGLCELTCAPGSYQYLGQVQTETDLVIIRVDVPSAPGYANGYFELYRDGIHKLSGWSWNAIQGPPHPIIIHVDFLLHPDWNQHVVFKLSAFPLT